MANGQYIRHVQVSSLLPVKMRRYYDTTFPSDILCFNVGNVTAPKYLVLDMVMSSICGDI